MSECAPFYGLTNEFARVTLVSMTIISDTIKICSEDSAPVLLTAKHLG